MAVHKATKHSAAPSDVRKTRLQKTSAVLNAAWYTTELLENILSHLDGKDLLTARGVCSKWQQTLDGSPSLQRQLYLRAATNIRKWCYDEGTDALRPYIEAEEDIHGDAWARRQGVCKPVVINPAFLRRDPDCESGKVPVRARFAEAKRLTFVRRPQLRTKKRTILNKMFLTQPPTTEVHIQLACAPYDAMRLWYHPASTARRIIVKRRRGVRWSDIEDGIRDRLNIKGRRLVEAKGGLKLLLSKTAVWACGVVLYNKEEREAIESGREDRPFKSV
ncbi:hypothetical protein AMS68_000442 [Peltaster fructicola]|uniref:F-box domain-containing protein n=1 Tax=Peltaster fructicola TaxID=286661 RepID=A0A6H0XJX8_9PEZI|nr:hypothetical protein AMS68_000442 [Peltaster fructicola]